jgi:hypothetical protein
MAGGYELTYRRLGAIEYPRECVAAALRFVRTTRLGPHEFRLIVSADEPPIVLPIFGVASDEPSSGTWEFDLRYSGEPRLDRIAIDAFLNSSHMKAFAQRSIGELDYRGQQKEWPKPDVQLAYPCTAEVVLSGRCQGQGKKQQQSFSSWIQETFSQQYAKLMSDRSKELRQAAEALVATDAFRTEAARALEDMAVNDLAGKLRHYAAVPNVIKRAAELFVVMDVMES